MADSKASGQEVVRQLERIAGLWKFSKAASKASHTFSMACVQDHVREVFGISGFDSFIPIHDTLADVPT